MSSNRDDEFRNWGERAAYMDKAFDRLWDKQDGRCKRCTVRLRLGDKRHPCFPHVDHIVPLARGGGNERRNLQLLCRTCNLSKGALTMEEWCATNPVRQLVAVTLRVVNPTTGKVTYTTGWE